VVQSARVSYGRGTKAANEDRGLIRYLMRHRHSTPFEMCEIKYHIKLPIFIARQWIRHRTANVNEYSARYSVLDREFYIPAPEQLAAQSAMNRQGRGDVLQGEEAARVLRLLRDDATRCYDHYVDMLNEDEQGAPLDAERSGLARELARMNLTLNAYTQWYWKTDLHNLFHFLSLRADAHAQFEIRVYAEAMMEAVEAWVPIAAGAFKDYRLGAVTFSAQMLAILRRMVAGEQVAQEGSGLSKREWRELMDALGRADG
jgi:thymidylate synthase (FAD)